jgi:hypothetical protein
VILSAIKSYLVPFKCTTANLKDPTNILSIVESKTSCAESSHVLPKSYRQVSDVSGCECSHSVNVAYLVLINWRKDVVPLSQFSRSFGPEALAVLLEEQ